MVLPAFRRDPRGGQHRQFDPHPVSDHVSKQGIVSDQDRLRGRIVLGLAEQVGTGPFDIVLAIGDQQDLTRAGDHIDPDHAEQLPLGLGHPGVAGTGHHIDRLDPVSAIGQRGNRLRPANSPHFVHAGQMRGGQYQRIDRALRRRRHHHQSLNPRYFRGDGVHQQRGGIGRTPAGHVESRCIDRQPARAKPDALFVGLVAVGGFLAFMVQPDALGREFQRGAQVWFEIVKRLAAGLGRNRPVGIAGERMAIPLAGHVRQGGVTATPHVRQDHFDIARNALVAFPPVGYQSAKCLREARVRGFQALQLKPPATGRRPP